MDQVLQDQASSVNRAHFDSTGAQRYDDQPLHGEMANRIGKAMLKVYPFSDESTTVLDYACGTGFNSRVLAPYIKSIVGVDISEGMVDKYNERVRNQGIPPDEMKAVCVQLEGREGELDDVKFDVVICCMSYHHFVSIAEVTRTLAFFLKPGGHLLVADVQSSPIGEDIFSEGVCKAGLVIHKAGFTEAVMKETFENAGLGSFGFNLVTRAIKDGHEVNIFLAQGVKP